MEKENIIKSVHEHTVFKTGLQSLLHELDGGVPLRLVRDGAILQSVVLDHSLGEANKPK